MPRRTRTHPCPFCGHRFPKRDLEPGAGHSCPEVYDAGSYRLQPGQRAYVPPRDRGDGTERPGISGMVARVSPREVMLIEFGTWGHRFVRPEWVRVQSPQLGTVEAAVFYRRWYEKRDPIKSAEAEQAAMRLAGRNARRNSAAREVA